MGNNSGMGLASWLTLLLVALKLTHFIDWSWWWVTSPLWGMVAVFAFVIIAAAVVAALSD